MKIIITQSSIVDLNVDVIVNPANPQLLRGGGLSGIIHKAAGEELFQWLKQYKFDNKIPGLIHGEVVISPSFNLQCEAIIHAVGPVWKDGLQNEKQILKQTYTRCLKLAEENQFTSIAFPNISTGIYGFPKEKAASLVIDVLNTFTSPSLEKIILSCHDQKNYALYEGISRSKKF